MGRSRATVKTIRIKIFVAGFTPPPLSPPAPAFGRYLLGDRFDDFAPGPGLTQKVGRLNALEKVLLAERRAGDVGPAIAAALRAEAEANAKGEEAAFARIFRTALQVNAMSAPKGASAFVLQLP